MSADRSSRLSFCILAIAFAAAVLLLGVCPLAAVEPLATDIPRIDPPSADAPQNEAPHASGDWMFDQARYTNDPKTGQRVIQYAKPKPHDRVSTLKYFSPDGPKPFGLWGDGYGYGWYGGGYPYGGWNGAGGPYFHAYGGYGPFFNAYQPYCW